MSATAAQVHTLAHRTHASCARKVYHGAGPLQVLTSLLVVAVFASTLIVALFCRAVFETLLKPALKIKFTWRKHPRWFWAALLCVFLTLSLGQLLFDGKGDMPVYGESVQGEPAQSSAEVFQRSTRALAPRPDNTPSVPANDTSPDTAGVDVTTHPLAIFDIQREAVSSMRSTVHFDEADLCVIFWRHQTGSPAEAFTLLVRPDVLTTELIWSFAISSSTDSTPVATATFKLGISYTSQRAELPQALAAIQFTGESKLCMCL